MMRKQAFIHLARWFTRLARYCWRQAVGEALDGPGNLTARQEYVQRVICEDRIRLGLCMRRLKGHL